MVECEIQTEIVPNTVRFDNADNIEQQPASYSREKTYVKHVITHISY